MGLFRRLLFSEYKYFSQWNERKVSPGNCYNANILYKVREISAVFIES